MAIIIFPNALASVCHILIQWQQAMTSSPVGYLGDTALLGHLLSGKAETPLQSTDAPPNRTYGNAWSLITFGFLSAGFPDLSYGPLKIEVMPQGVQAFSTTADKSAMITVFLVRFSVSVSMSVSV